MNILHVNTYNTGGAANACLRIHQGLLDINLNSKVLLRNKTLNSTPHVYEIWDYLSTSEKTIKYLKSKAYLRKQHNILRKVEKLDELLSFPEAIWDITKHPLYNWADIIHLHWVSGFVDYPSFFKKNTKNLIWTIHDEEPFTGGFHYPHYTNEHNNSYLNQLTAKKLALKKEALKKQTISVISPSHFLKNKSKKSALFSNYEHYVIKNCANTEQFNYIKKDSARSQLNWPLDEKIILFVADNIDYKRKGFSLLLNAISSMPEKNLSLYAIGNSKNKIEHNKVKYIGKIDSEKQLNLLYSGTDFLFVPSVYDNFPNTISEALCSGSPVLATNVGGIPEMIEPSYGLTCNPDSNEIGRLILKGFSKNWNREEISQQNKSIYDPKKCALEYHKIYQKTFSKS